MWTFRHFAYHWKKVKIFNNKLTVIQEHLLYCNYPLSFKDLFILTRKSNDFKPKIMKSKLIARDKPILNKKVTSFPLELFKRNIIWMIIIWCFAPYMMSIYPIVRIQLWFVQFSFLCHKFCVLKHLKQDKWRINASSMAS